VVSARPSRIGEVKVGYRTQVVSGPRSPKDNPERQGDIARSDMGMVDLAIEALNSHKAAAVPAPRPAGVRCFGSPYRNFMLTIKVSDEVMVNGITIPARLKTIVFQDAEHRTSDPVEIAAIERHKNYGRDIWDSDEIRRKAERVAGENLLRSVDTLPPDIKEQLRAKLTDFALPAPEAEAPSA
jgi:hypothetical protein